MISFDFITDDEFRNSLESDYNELISCKDNKAYKSVHVLGGSIIEAILIDYLISEKIIPRDKALKLDLGEAIKICLEKEIISAKTYDLCSVIKSYRNLIHPGRMIRLNESVSMESANVVVSLVSIVVGEVAKRRRENYGYTAEQIVSKIENDPGARSIIPNLLSNSNPIELERIMLDTLPKHYLSLPDYIDTSYTISAYIECFHTAFNLSSEQIKTKVATRLAKSVKEESGENLIAYGTLFIRTEYFEYMTDYDLNLVKKYQLSRFNEGTNIDFLTALEGIGNYLNEEEVLSFVDTVVKIIYRSNNSRLRQKAKDFFFNEVLLTRIEIDELILQRLGDWVKFFEDKGQDDNVKKVKELITYVETPF